MVSILTSSSAALLLPQAVAKDGKACNDHNPDTNHNRQCVCRVH
jgi:hypothetical protein